MDKEKKQKMIGLLKHAIIFEEKAIPLYSRHLAPAVFWAGLPEDAVAKIKETLLVLEKETFLPAYPFLESFDLALRFPEFSRVRPPSAVPDALLIPLPADRSMLPDGRGT